LQKIVDWPTADTARFKPLIASNHDLLIAESAEFLASDKSSQGIKSDPYWPKWNSSWWHMLLLHELGRTQMIPSSAIERMLSAIDSHYIHFFPFEESELPANVDATRHVACHCELGTMYQVLATYGIDVDARLPWIRPWFLRYQLADGGLNCDETAYIRKLKNSSVVSTLPALEAVLFNTQRDLSEQEVSFLNSGAKYLIERKLFRRRSTNEVIDPDWLKLTFPRFYFYDMLRGLHFLVHWADQFNTQLPIASIQETVVLLDEYFPTGIVYVQRAAWAGQNSHWYDAETNAWIKGKAASYGLLESVSKIGSVSDNLTESWRNAKLRINLLLKKNLLL